MPLNDLFKNLSRFGRPPYGYVDDKTGEMRTTPWSWRSGGIYVNEVNDVWLYMELPTLPTEWEDPPRRIDVGLRLQRFLLDLERMSRSAMSEKLAIRSLAEQGYRKVHLVSTVWDEVPEPPEGTPEDLAKYLRENFSGATFPSRAMFVGVKLRVSSMRRATSTLSMLANLASSALGDSDVPDLEAFADDYDRVLETFVRYKFIPLSQSHQKQLESWYNLGRGPDAEVIYEKEHLVIDRTDVIELAALRKFAAPKFAAPFSQWISDAMAHQDGPRIVSIRADLENPEVARARARKSQRKIAVAVQEEQASEELARVEYSTTAALAKDAEDFFAATSEPLLTNSSIIMGRRVSEMTDTYISFLQQSYGIVMRPLEHQQLLALDETLPASVRKVSPSFQDLSVGMVSMAGMSTADTLGDARGVFVGLTQRDLAPVYQDPKAASEENRQGTTLIAGDSGSGKTFLLQSLCIQSVLNGQSTIFINPKPMGALSGLITLPELADRVQAVHMSALKDDRGFFDPFFYMEPYAAVELLMEHITTVLSEGITDADRITLSTGMKEGVDAGARCAGEALSHVKNRRLVKYILDAVSADSLFALAFHTDVRNLREEYRANSGLTVIEFDQPLALPDPSTPQGDYNYAQRSAVAAMRLVTRASMEILGRSRGGVLAVDEAWTFLAHPSGMALLQAIGRLSRSQRIMALLATQKPSDALNSGMEDFLSRIFILKLDSEQEAARALDLIRLEVTPERIDFIRNCGPVAPSPQFPSGEPAMGLVRDLRGRHSAVVFGPTPQRIIDHISTNSKDVDRREESERVALEASQERSV